MKPTAVTVTKRGRRHTPEEIAARLAEYRASGLTREEFAARAGLRPATLQNWHYRPRPPAGRPQGPAFVRVPVPAARPGTLTVRWPEGPAVELAVALDEAGIVRVVRGLLTLTPCSQ